MSTSGVTLMPDRLIARKARGDEEIVRPRRVVDLLPHLLRSLDVHPSVKLGDLLKLLDTDDVEVLTQILHEDVGSIVAEARKGPEVDPPDPDDPREYTCMRVYNCHETGTIARCFDGWGTYGPSIGGEGIIPVDLVPIAKLLLYPLRYDPELVFETSAGKVEYRTTITITFLEFLKAIFWELTFHGTPQMRDDFLQELIRENSTS